MTLTVPMTHFIRAYLRASTKEQDAQRARGSLDRFAHEHGVVICNYYAENESGAHLKRPELFRLLADSQPSDILLVEDIDRLSRLACYVSRHSSGFDPTYLRKTIGVCLTLSTAVIVPMIARDKMPDFSLNSACGRVLMGQISRPGEPCQTV